MKRNFFLPFLLCFLFCGVTILVQAQSIHEKEAEKYKHLDFKTDAEYDRALGRDTQALKRSKTTNAYRRTGQPLAKKVFGWHPYYQGETYQNYDFSNLHTIAYFSYEVDPSTGSFRTLRTWESTGLIAAAHAAGVKVVLTVTNFGSDNNAMVLQNPARRETLISTLLSKVKARGGDGVNIDFEVVAATERDALTSFMNELATRFHTELPGSKVSIALPGLFSETNAFDVAGMTQVDDFIIMGYDYWVASSPYAGPVAPLAGSSWSYWGPTNNVTKSVSNYLTKLPASKLFLAVPYYGRRWATTTNAIGATATTVKTIASESRLYHAAKTELATKNLTRQWNKEGSVPYYVYQENGQWFQTFYDDAESLGLKYDLVNEKNLAGIGIWALGYDNTPVNPELNNLLREKFSPAPLASSDELAHGQGTLFPNPVKRGQEVFLRNPQNTAPVSLRLHDAVGRLLAAPVHAANGFINTEDLAAGVYFVTVTTPAGSLKHRLVVVE